MTNHFVYSAAFLNLNSGFVVNMQLVTRKDS